MPERKERLFVIAEGSGSQRAFISRANCFMIIPDLRFNSLVQGLRPVAVFITLQFCPANLQPKVFF
jgi:hypothetical protein